MGQPLRDDSRPSLKVTAETKTPRHFFYEFFMLILTVAVVAMVTVETFGAVNSDSANILHLADFVICFVFFFDFLWRLWTEKRRFRYFLTIGWLDLISCVPMVGFTRYARLVRVVRMIRLLRGFKSVKNLASAIDDNKSESVIFTSILILLFTIFFGAIAVINFESSFPESNIKTASDAVWWCCVTMTTTGYGDFYPRSLGGRVVAVFLMMSGLGLTAIYTALFATWLMKGKT